jgi:hypothetical protein
MLRLYASREFWRLFRKYIIIFFKTIFEPKLVYDRVDFIAKIVEIARIGLHEPRTSTKIFDRLAILVTDTNQNYCLLNDFKSIEPGQVQKQNYALIFHATNNKTTQQGRALDKIKEAKQTESE